MNFGTIIYTWLYGKLVGKDQFNNKYFCNSKDFSDLKSKRWVIFSGEIEASNIPPHWHAWLHKSIDVPPINYIHKYNWQKDHQPNFTGTKKAYDPKSQSNEGITNKDYETWTP